ncbi:MAG: PEGA domain-containing protein [Vicinamibacterales bacterium]
MKPDSFDLSGVDEECRQPADRAPHGPPFPRSGGPASGGLFAWYEPGYSDGLGDRLRLFDNTEGPPLELLRLRPELAGVPHFEFFLRERTFELAHFEDRRHARVCRVDRLPEPGGGLAVVCERADGLRLADVLRAAERRSLRPSPDVTLALVAELLSAVAALHGRGRHINHGALGPDRIVVAPGGSLVVTEYVFGSALRRLPYERDRLWLDFGFAVPADPAATPFDQQTDVFQAGLVALALTLGRRLAPQDYPAGLPGLMREARELSSAAYFQWLERALGAGSETFKDGLEAKRVFVAAAGSGADRSLHPAFWPALLAASEDCDWMSAAPEAGGRRARSPVSTRSPLLSSPSDSVRYEAVLDSPVASGCLPGAEEETPSPAAPHDAWGQSLDPTHRNDCEDAPLALTLSEAGAMTVGQGDANRGEGPLPRADAVTGWRRWQVAALVALSVVASVETLYIVSRGLPPAKPAVLSGGRLTIASEPSGAEVSMDGKPAGRTPLTLDVRAGRHVVELSVGTRRRTVTLSVESGSSVSHFIELPQALPEAGSLRVTTEPPGAEVRLDGERRGVAPLVLRGLAPGPHEIVVSRGNRIIRQTVAIESGVTAALLVPIPAASELAAGWVTIRSAVDLHVFERNELIGISRSGRIMLPAGRHEVEVANEAVAFRAARQIDVPPGGTVVVDVEMPLTTIDVNATPWAEAWIDGRRVGETPLGGVPVAIGPHEVRFSHPQLGERRVDCVVSLQRPTRLSVDPTK